MIVQHLIIQASEVVCVVPIWQITVCTNNKTTYVKVKQSRHRPGVAQGVPGS
jgi:hypothetical protein